VALRSKLDDDEEEDAPTEETDYPVQGTVAFAVGSR
jgi:hypothetical protein